VVGFPPGIVTDGTIHSADAVAAQAQADLVAAYDTAAGESPQTAVTGELGGQTLPPGVYGNDTGAGTLGLTGTVTLDAQGDPNALFVFQAASTLTTASGSTVSLINGADPCNVYWQVGSSATLGTGSDFAGSILALTSITVTTGASVEGRVLARNAAVTLDTNDITRPDCLTSTATATPTASTTPSTTPSSGPGSGSGGGSGTSTPTPGSTSSSSPTPSASASSGSGSGSGGSGSGSGSGSSDSPIPVGHPETGEGGAAGSVDNLLLLGGGLALAGAVLASALAARRPYASRHSSR
jgi:hypothetical protein